MLTALKAYADAGTQVSCATIEMARAAIAEAGGAPGVESAERVLLRRFVKAFDDEADAVEKGEDCDLIGAMADLCEAARPLLADGAPAAEPVERHLLRAILDGGSWHDDGTFVYNPHPSRPFDAVEA